MSWKIDDDTISMCINFFTFFKTYVNSKEVQHILCTAILCPFHAMYEQNPLNSKLATRSILTHGTHSIVIALAICSPVTGKSSIPGIIFHSGRYLYWILCYSGWNTSTEWYLWILYGHFYKQFLLANCFGNSKTFQQRKFTVVSIMEQSIVLSHTAFSDSNKGVKFYGISST